MSSTSLFHVAEWGALFMAVLAALGLATLPKRILDRESRKSRWPLARWAIATIRSLIFPAFSMALGWLVLWAPEGLGASWAGLYPASHRAAWNLFWLVIGVFSIAETAAMQILSAAGKAQLPALLRSVFRALVTALAALAVLHFELGWNITPILASTALVTAVVGFALQGVLGNLLAGMSLNLTGAMAHRDWVFIDDLEGQVEEMNWRETWVVTHQKIPVRIPNSVVANARIRNLSRPEGPRRCSIFVDASYGDAPDNVIAAMLAAAAAVTDVCREPRATALLHEFKSYGIGYELWIWLNAYHLREPVMGEVRRHIWYQFRRHGIQIPYPVTDQVLNDFMERAIMPATLPAADPEALRRAAGLLHSDFANKVLKDANGTMLVSEEELSAWAARLPGQLYGRDEVLFRQGDSGDCCYVVLSGLLTGRIRDPASGQETSFELGADAVVGEMSLMTGLPRTAEIRVKESAELLQIPAPEFAALMGKHAGVMEQLSQLVSERMQQNRKQFESLMAAGTSSMDHAISREGILKRFWHLLGRRK